MHEYVDQIGNTVKLPNRPQRIISLVPSQTELLHDLGLEEEVVGITKFCVHPGAWYLKKARVGGTKSLDIEKIKLLAPDLIIANKEENTQEQIAELSEHFPVWVSNVESVDSAIDMIKEIGRVTGKSAESKSITSEINSRFLDMSLNSSPKKVAYLIWHDPLMTVGKTTFINDLLKKMNWQNVFEEELSSRYPIVSDQNLVKAKPDLLLLSSEPYPFGQKHIEHFQQLLPSTQVMLVDGEMFSWYGSRMRLAPEYLKSMLQTVEQ
jgi:ABC-type Fe3+-hydroxamate transport system substrate-binding protein